MNADLMGGLGITLGSAHLVGWGNVLDYVRHLPQGSATWRALNPELAAFSSPARQSAILSDIYDAVMMCVYATVRMHRGKMAKPKPYPRPGGDDGTRKLGRGAISIAEFEKWYYGTE